MQLTRNVKNVIEFGLQNDLEIISYGLAPNPNGFCFESHGKASRRVIISFAKRLERLTKAEVEQVKKIMFGAGD